MKRRTFLGNVGATAAVGGVLSTRQAKATTSAPESGAESTGSDEPWRERLAQPWTLTEQDWTAIVGAVTPGRRLKPKAWPNGSRFAVALSFDCDHEAAILAGGSASPGRIAWAGHRSRRVGVPRILDVLKRHEVPASFYIPAVAALIDPVDTRRIVAEGHEVGLHGWIHVNNSQIPPALERELAFRAREALEKVTGSEIVGHRSANFDLGPNTIKLVAELGLEYDSSMMADDSCYELLVDGGKPTGLVEVPVEWVRDDAVYLGFNRAGGRPLLSPVDVFEVFKQELESAAAEGDVFELLMHPHVIGHRSRIWILERIIEHAKGLGGAWFGTHAQVARWAKDNAA
jgi:peptidoglycan/xylan/chitin deacetylase (PgdA/CDA1 family)